MEVVDEADHPSGVASVVQVLGEEAAREIGRHRRFDPAPARLAHPQSRQHTREGVSQRRLEPWPDLPLNDPIVDDLRPAPRRIHRVHCLGLPRFATVAVAMRAVRLLRTLFDDDLGGGESSPVGEREGEQRAATLRRQKARLAHEGHGPGDLRLRWRQCAPAQDRREPRRFPIARSQRRDSFIAAKRLAQLPKPAVHVAKPEQRVRILGIGRHGALQRRRGAPQQAVRAQQQARQIPVARRPSRPPPLRRPRRSL